MDMFKAIILGIVQGLTEFLPVSSSGHLVLLQKIMGIDEPTLFFDTMLHLGTLAAVLIVLRKDIWALLKRPFQRLTGLVVLATLPTIAIALIIKDFVEQAFHTGDYIGYGFLATSLILLAAEALAARPGARRQEKDMTWVDAVLIGTLQGAAIMPAVSRSGSTIAGALSRRLDRDFAARFSFLMSIPAILGAAVLQAKDLFDNQDGLSAAFGAAGSGSVGVDLWVVVAGTAVAAAVGVFAVSLMLKIIRTGTLRGFALYTAVLGVLVLADQFFFHLVF
jgi:undecaprenyl-diphosphatase